MPRIGLFHLKTGEKTFFEAHGGEGVSSAAFDSDGTRLLSGGDDGCAKLWDIEKSPPTEIKVFPRLQEMLMWAAISPDGKQVAVVGRDQTVHVYSTETGQAVHNLVGHENTVFRAEFSPDGGQLATVSGDATVRFWDLETGSLLFAVPLPTHSGPPSPLWDFDFRCARLPDGSTGRCRMVVPLTSGRLAVYDLGEPFSD